MKKYISNLMSRIKSNIKKLNNGDPQPQKPKAIDTNKVQEYYDTASGWAYDIFDAVTVSRDRWKLFGIVSIVMQFMLLIIIMMMLPLKQYIPFVVHTEGNGVIWVEAPQGSVADDAIPKETMAQMRSDLYRFMQSFESYDPYTTLHTGKDYVKNMASPTVYAQFNAQLSAPDSYFSRLGARGSRKVLIESISMLNYATKTNGLSNTALVQFKSREVSNLGVVNNIKEWQATVVFKYKGIPKDPIQQFINHNGFKVTSYQVVPFNQGVSNDQ
jgi:type IV secretory pathway component VirB8